MNYWSVFYDLFVDEYTANLIRSQAEKLCQASESMQTWTRGPYQDIIRMVDSETLNILHEFWTKYANFKSDRKLYDSLKSDCKRTWDRHIGPGSSWGLSRSFGPRVLDSTKIAVHHAQAFWETGNVESQNVSQQQSCNPLFIYSYASGDRFSVHYATNPLAPFHLGTGLTKLAPGSPFYQDLEAGTTLDNVVTTAKLQFREWCKAFQGFTSKFGQLRIRVFVGDAIAFCFGLNKLRAPEHVTSLNYYSRPWSQLPVALDSDDYNPDSDDHAPLQFNVIDTSNLADHVGFISLLVSTIPLLQYSPSSTLHTETMNRAARDEATLLSDLLCHGNVRSMCTLFGIAPVGYLTGVSTRGYFQDDGMSFDDSQPSLNRITWKFPATLDPAVKLAPIVACDPEDLAKLLYTVYLNMFSWESIEELRKTAQSEYQKSLMGKVSIPKLPHYTRSSYAALLAFLKPRISVNWEHLMLCLLRHIEMDRQLMIGLNSVQDLFLQLHLFGAFTRFPFDEEVDGLRIPGYPPLLTYRPTRGVLKHKNPPKLTCLIVTVPRSKLRALYDKAVKNEQTKGVNMIFQLNILAGNVFHNMFSSIHPIFGKLILSENGEKCEIEQDAEGWHGKSDLHFCTYVPTYMFFVVPLKDVNVSIRLLNEVSSQIFRRELGMELEVFGTRLLDDKFVNFVESLPGLPVPRVTSLPSTSDSTSVSSPLLTTETATFTIRFTIKEEKDRKILSNGEDAKVSKSSPCTISIVCGSLTHTFQFPFPVAKNSERLRIARKSGWIEIIPTLSIPPTGASSEHRFPLIPDGNDIYSWNMPYITFKQLPQVDLSDPKSLDWILPHLVSMFSHEERRLQNENLRNGFIKFKESIVSIFQFVAGYEGIPCRVLGFKHKNGNDDIQMLLFVTGIYLDGNSHSIVAEAYLLPTKYKDDPILAEAFGASIDMMMQIVVDEDELKFWKYTLPAMSERCREWEHGSLCEYRKGIPASLEEGKSPICSCGRGKVSDHFARVTEWKDFAPYVTRVAITPIFAVPFVEHTRGVLDDSSQPVMSNPSESKCQACGKPSKKKCSRCEKVGYCCRECQRKDWKSHKKSCRP